MAFYVETPTNGGRSRLDDPALDFNLENMTENVVNGLFCTYEPPTSTKSKFEAVKDARTNPHKFTLRPRVPPKSILRYKYSSSKRDKKKNKKKSKKKKKKMKEDYDYNSDATSAASSRGGGSSVYTTTTNNNNRSVTWRDQQKQTQRTKIENDVVKVADKYLGSTFSQGESIADELSPQVVGSGSRGGAAQQSFPFGRGRNRDPATTSSSRRSATPRSKVGSTSSASFLTDIDTNTTATATTAGGRTLYDDEGNPIEEDDDDLESRDDDRQFSDGFISTTPTPRDSVVLAQSPSASSVATSFTNFTTTTTKNGSGNDYSSATATAIAAAAAVVGAGCKQYSTGCKLSSTARGPRPHMFCNGPPEEMIQAISPTKARGESGPNLMCSGFSFLATAMAACGGGDPSSSSSPTPTPEQQSIRSSLSDPDISAELDAAQKSLGVYEPENYDQSPGRNSGIKFTRQPTPKHLHMGGMRGGRGRGRGRAMQNLDDKLDEKEKKKKKKKKKHQQRELIVVEDVLSPCNSAEVASDITMGNATISHFGKNRSNGDSSTVNAEDYASLFDDGEGGCESDTTSAIPKGHKKSNSSGSVVDELKQLFSEGGIRPAKFKKNNSKKAEIPSADVNSIKKQLEKSIQLGTGKKSSVVTNSYLKSINTDRKSPMATDSYLSSVKSGLVASRKQELETRGTDPSERRGGGSYSFNRSGILPPTPNNKLKSQNGPSPRSRSFGRVRDLYAALSPKTCATDDELREEVSTENVVSMGRPVMRHSSLEVITGSALHKNDDDDEYLDGIEDERQNRVGVVSKKKKSKKSKNKSTDDDKKKSGRISAMLSPKSSKKSVTKKEHRSFAKPFRKSAEKFKRAFKKSCNSVVGSRIQREEGEQEDVKKKTKKQKPPLEISINY